MRKFGTHSSLSEENDSPFHASKLVNKQNIMICVHLNKNLNIFCLLCMSIELRKKELKLGSAKDNTIIFLIN